MQAKAVDLAGRGSAALTRPSVRDVLGRAARWWWRGWVAYVSAAAGHGRFGGGLGPWR